jgi:arsenate reductase (thioredoxin)
MLCASRAGVAVMIESATLRDLPEIRALLERLHLPLEGVDEHLATMLVAREAQEIVGLAGLELYSEGALLRSVGVEPRWQGKQLGHRLTDAALQLATTHGARAVFLLTTTAERFFPKFGFEQIAREQVPPSVRQSVEFQSACPASAIVMRRQLVSVVLFACVHNAGRSQIASAWFNLLSDPTKARAISAGTHPAPRVHPEVVAAMNEVGIDLSSSPTSKLTMALTQHAQMIITMGCGDQCPVVPGLKRDDWPLEDPKNKPLARVREIRDEIRHRVEMLLQQEGWYRATGG